MRENRNAVVVTLESTFSAVLIYSMCNVFIREQFDNFSMQKLVIAVEVYNFEHNSSITSNLK